VVHGQLDTRAGPAFGAYAKSEGIDTKTEEKEGAKVIITIVFSVFGVMILIMVIISLAAWFGRFMPLWLTAILMLIASFCGISNPFAIMFLFFGCWALMARYNYNQEHSDND
jgi:hypothetical protein